MGYLLTILMKFGIYALFGVGIHLVFSQAGIVYLGMPAIVAFSGYVLAVVEKFGCSPWLAFLIAMAAGLLMGLMLVYFYLKLSADAFTVLGFVSIFALVALFNSWESVTNGTLGIVGVHRPEIISSLFGLTVFALICGIGAFVFDFFVNKSAFGRKLRAYKEFPIVLDAQSINSKKIAVKVIMISTFLFALGGILITWQLQSIEPNFGGQPLLVEILTLGILALSPKILDVLISVLIVVMLPEVLRFVDLSASDIGYLRVILYSVMLIVLIYKFDKKIFVNRSV